MPAGQGKDAERFAAAVEQGTPPGFAGDGDLARELEIVAMLRSRGAAFAPDPDAKARAKQRLMAVLAAEQGDRRPRGPQPPVPPPSAEEQTAPLGRINEPSFPAQQEGVNASAVTSKLPAYTGRGDEGGDTTVEATTTEAATAEGTPPSAPAGRPGRHSSRRTVSRPAGRARGSRGPATTPAGSGLRRRAVFVGSAALVMLLAIAGGGVFASRDALPGDNLYALKRVAESAGLALTFDESAKARRHLDIATTRLDEVQKLVDRTPQAPVAPDVYASAIQEFDAAAGEGSRLLLKADKSSTADTTALGDLQSWASQEADRLTTLRPALPDTAAADAEGAIKLLDRLVGRTTALTARSSCSEVTSGTDDLGPLPAAGACAPRPHDSDAPETGTTGGNGRHQTDQDPSSTTPGENDDPTSDVTQTPGADEPPSLLPDLDSDGNLFGNDSNEGSDRDDTSTTTRSRNSENNDGNGDDDDTPAPGLPRLLPPVTLPPLLPGMPGITIG
ncbi:DUF5667 domain-containing protein [Pseudonocardia sp. CA-142604]|uniref:DUF5667 domain-containing protein n=1 Tax=Pseudonocardia sp. CA-142604 TaxID=3240024 RepID=UPI003D93582D